MNSFKKKKQSFQNFKHIKKISKIILRLVLKFLRLQKSENVRFEKLRKITSLPMNFDRQVGQLDIQKKKTFNPVLIIHLIQLLTCQSGTLNEPEFIVQCIFFRYFSTFNVFWNSKRLYKHLKMVNSTNLISLYNTQFQLYACMKQT